MEVSPNLPVRGQSEEQALTVAEAIDYGVISSLERLYGYGSSVADAYAYMQAGTYSYIWANFIDSEVIDYYQTRYDYQQKQKNPKEVTFRYDTNVTYLEQLRIPILHNNSS
ncbi:MAG: hypothetical protein LBQ98_04660 [Nitrososphaerota archaeon]|nr:hypothetical protein [Nitrososphaerota archaeon]